MDASLVYRFKYFQKGSRDLTLETYVKWERANCRITSPDSMNDKHLSL